MYFTSDFHEDNVTLTRVTLLQRNKYGPLVIKLSFEKSRPAQVLDSSVLDLIESSFWKLAPSHCCCKLIPCSNTKSSFCYNPQLRILVGEIKSCEVLSTSH